MSDARISHEVLARIGAGDLERFTDDAGYVIEEPGMRDDDSFNGFNQMRSN